MRGRPRCSWRCCSCSCRTCSRSTSGNFAHYNAIYGSLGAVIAFMFFVYLAGQLFLLGAEIASEWPRVRDELEREGPAQNGQPLLSQIRAALRGLWAHGEEPARAPQGTRGRHS